MYLQLTPTTEVYIGWNDPACEQDGIDYMKGENGGFMERELWLGKLYVSVSIKMNDTIPV